MKTTIIFDFDGTLADVQSIFFRIVNDLAKEFHYSPIASEEIERMKELHLRQFVFRRLGWRILLFPKILARGREEYYRLIPEVNLFPGITALLETLQTNGMHIGIVSSSEKRTVQGILKKHRIQVDFLYQSTLFSKASTLRKAMKEQSLSLDETVYIGDEVRDIEACQKITLPIIAVTWGLNSKASLAKRRVETVDTVTELAHRLLS